MNTDKRYDTEFDEWRESLEPEVRKEVDCTIQAFIEMIPQIGTLILELEEDPQPTTMPRIKEMLAAQQSLITELKEVAGERIAEAMAATSALPLIELINQVKQEGKD